MPIEGFVRAKNQVQALSLDFSNLAGFLTANSNSGYDGFCNN